MISEGGGRAHCNFYVELCLQSTEHYAELRKKDRYNVCLIMQQTKH